ncbi:11088_t:CDS:2 [Funneliformis geosporum]|nr:11088_t:CDS:2 [Funneliformis geosporum]
MNSFEDYKTSIIKNIASNANTDLVIIPGDLTSVFQPLDVYLNKLFKDRLRENGMLG